MVDALTKNVKHLIAALHLAGVNRFVLSPGSRSTPVALLLAEQAATDSDYQLYVDVDERSAAFFALGMAKVSQEPVAVLVTSGTAAAELMPAVAEANQAQIPLVLLTADRPQELQGLGAAQTLPQSNLYGDLVDEVVTLNLQDPHPDMTAYIDFKVQTSVRSHQQKPAPIQINLPLRKPLMPVLGDRETLNIQPVEYPINHWTYGQPIDPGFDQNRVLVLAGPNTGADYYQALNDFTQKYRVPVLADVLSRVRDQNSIYNFKGLLEAGLPAELTPDLVLWFGALPTDPAILAWLKTHQVTVWQVGPQAGQDPSRQVSRVYPGAVADFLNRVQGQPSQQQATYYQSWQSWLGKLSPHQTGDDLAQVVATLNDHSAADTMIFSANSLAVRALNDYWAGSHSRLVYANRGVNGIDGVVSTALGASLVHPGRTVLLIGDLTLFHDMNGLALVKKYGLNLDIVLVDNHGGGIFKNLPQGQAAEAQPYFEEVFGTPLDLDFKLVAQLYGLAYIDLERPADLGPALDQQPDHARLLVLTTPDTKGLEENYD
ncbi:2-succinyl-5-enolpyruvyl-6-hydroxy-3-cyclohexene-1-carboxylic-acid synthase [Lactobacillaceae bacterium L1_55_11]|nr:2-succinyl-5-enolpyruvyl-6-hydroxy-3-cyclohexene-1-carboxylic-acid synthase [Lactobacillaceae bacterium L1_55_11]